MNHKISTIFLGVLILLAGAYFVMAEISPITPSLNLNGQNQFTINNYSRIGLDLYVTPNSGSDIQTKINLANANDRIIIPKGNYTVSSKINVTKNITLVGYGDDSVIYGNFDDTILMVNATAKIGYFKVVMNNPTSNLHDAVVLEDNSDGSLVEGLTVMNPTKSGILAKSTSERVTIDRAKVYNAGLGTDEGRGIYINAPHSRVLNSYVKNSSRYGIQAQPSGAGYITMENNFIDGARRVNGSSGRGYFIVECMYCTVRGGEVRDAALTGINIITSSNYTTVEGVNFYDIYGNSGGSEARGIEIQQSDFVTIRGNYVHNVTNINTSLQYNSVGIYVEANNVFLENNIIDDVTSGIIADSNYNKIFVQGNFIYNSTGRLSEQDNINREKHFGWWFDPVTRFASLGNTQPKAALEIQQEDSPYFAIVGQGGNNADEGGISFTEDRASWNGTNWQFKLRHDGSANKLVFEDTVEKFSIFRFQNLVAVNNTILFRPSDTGATCNAGNDGATFYNGTTLQICNGSSYSSITDWTKLSNFPVACPAGSFVSTLGNSVTCTSPSATQYTNLTATNMTILSNLIFTNSSGTPKWRMYVNDTGSLITESIA